MATYTSRLNLKKPAGNENINISDINGNMDLIDAEVTYRNQRTTWSSETTVTQFINACETAMGSQKGLTFLGYINYSVVEPWGLDFNGYVLGLYHTEGYKAIFIVASGNNCRFGKITKINGVWDERIHQSSENRYVLNESISSTFEGFGRLTSSGTKIAFSIPLPKNIPSNLTPVLQTGSRFEIRGITGYVGNFTAGNSEEVVGNSDYSLYVVRRNLGATLHIEITKTSGNFGITNNTPIQAYCSVLKVNFE